jgi:hypothetical protein
MYLLLQTLICNNLTAIDNKIFQEDNSDQIELNLYNSETILQNIDPLLLETNNEEEIQLSSIISSNILITENITLNLKLEESSITLNKYFKDLELIKQDIAEKNYSTAIYALNELSSRLRDHQKKKIEKYFPSEFEGYAVWKPSFQYDVSASYPDDYGLLFSKKYRNFDGYTIDVNVVYSDPAIEEYINIVKNPSLIDSIENIKVIKIGRYNALEKYSEEERYCERNIIINDALLLNIIANGLEDKSVIERYTKQVNLEGLEYYLIR